MVGLEVEGCSRSGRLIYLIIECPRKKVVEPIVTCFLSAGPLHVFQPVADPCCKHRLGLSGKSQWMPGPRVSRHCTTRDIPSDSPSVYSGTKVNVSHAKDCMKLDGMLIGGTVIGMRTEHFKFFDCDINRYGKTQNAWNRDGQIAGRSSQN
ncbi:hypothetical protein HPP92_028865 [Vanilla planifolia]|uniref:Uncharacterized protein n=1 Tax=Vanilla planifolia TaxID=51239 RepID=A0A835P5S6_VANPL|nr:hypothetical protein HPP92_028865 [Vanilla planifolia]KAG0446398.1 hypothetical protein HPP92_028854 [Vanilla planifolia]